MNQKTWKMKNWIPINKKTGIKYPAITDNERTELLADRLLAGKYEFLPINTSSEAPAQAKPAPEPKEAKKTEKENKNNFFFLRFGYTIINTLINNK